MTPRKHFTQKLLVSCLLIILLGLAVSFAGYARLGVLHGGDTGRYLSGAESMAQGKALSSKQKLFLGYIRLIWLVKSLGGSQTEVVILQCLLSLLAGLALFYAGLRAFSLPVGLLAACLFLVSPDIQRWNFYILTDGPANSMLALALALAVLSTYSPVWCALLAPAMIWYAFLRPESCFLLLFLLPLAARKPRITAVTALSCLGLVWIWIQGGSAADAYNMAAHWDQGTVIWGYQPTNLPPPAVLENTSQPGLADAILQYTVAYPLWSLQLMANRLFWFFSHLRPFYTQSHNLAALGQSLVLMGLMIYALLRWRLKNIALVLVAGLLILQSGVVALTHADWDGRHLVRLMGPLYLVGSAAAVHLFNMLKGRKPSSAPKPD